MKTQPPRNLRTNSDARPSPPANRSSNQRRISEGRSMPPVVSLRRYPSLYQDFEPLIQRKRRTDSATSPEMSSDRPDGEFPYVRVLALLVIIAIIAALAANN